MGEAPQFRLIRKSDDGKKWDNIGAAWNRDSGGFSVVIELKRGGEKIKCLMVENKPKAETKAQEIVPQNNSYLNDEVPF